MPCTTAPRLFLVALALLARQPATAPSDDDAAERAQIEREQRELRRQMPTRVEGTVTDAENGQPIARFRFMPGVHVKDAHRPFRRFDWHEAKYGEDGRYEWVDPGHQPELIIRIDADGYEPVVSEGLSDHQIARFDAKLKRAANITGAVMTPDGKPADDAVLLFATKDAPVAINNEEPPQQIRGPTATAGADGSFVLWPLTGDWRVVVLHDSGTAEVDRDDFLKDHAIALQPWARIEGTLKLGAKPGAGATILHYSLPRVPYERMQIDRISTVHCDDLGQFVFERVFPGKGHVARQVEMVGPERHRLTTVSQPNAIDLKPGETAHINLGGVGRAVIGRVTRPDGIPENWLAHGNTLIETRDIPGRPRRQYHFGVAADGTFRIDDVEPGDYRLLISFSEVPGVNTAIGPTIADVEHVVHVPETPAGQSDEPVDIGELTVKPRGNK